MVLESLDHALAEHGLMVPLDLGAKVGQERLILNIEDIIFFSITGQLSHWRKCLHKRWRVEATKIRQPSRHGAGGGGRAR